MPNNINPYVSSFTIPKPLHVDELSFDGQSVTIHASTENRAAKCPSCSHFSRRIHRVYRRTLADLPWCGVPVCLRLRVRKFFCDNSSCSQRIFAERLEEVARAYARCTDRQREALEWIALALGGEAGARLGCELGLRVSPDTLLNRVRGISFADTEGVQVLGVDDFGFRKGNASGTILVDLERHEIVDLLQGHSTELIAQWLRRRPGVQVVSRDRSHVCREAIEAGAPEAMQVADRWHLLHNLTQVLEEFLLQKRTSLQKAAAPEGKTTMEGETTVEDVGAPGPMSPNRPRLWQARQQEKARKRHERLVEQWRNIRRLYLARADLRDICRQLGISARTVYRYKDLKEPPPRPAYKRRASVLDPYVPYLLGRWNEGCHNGKRLYREIRERGYTNSEKICVTFIAELRRAQAAGKPPSSVPRARKGSVAGNSPTAKNVAALFMRREEKLNGEHKEYLQRLCASDAALADAHRLTQEFAKMVRNLEGEKLDGWLKEADASDAAVMQRFSAGLKKDLKAVRAGLTESWSTGPVEGFINKLKLLKRQGYGRANFDLLRARALAA
jgi:transposase